VRSEIAPEKRFVGHEKANTEKCCATNIAQKIYEGISDLIWFFVCFQCSVHAKKYFPNSRSETEAGHWGHSSHLNLFVSSFASPPLLL
jgi:hypothetical protein